ncbi:MAG: hypothetical protein JO293_00385 [Candidatus Eremiobacteraeota bacterium]|nr:hypothetical protein [Candidatus Eremiobacteraeota bacterium]
MRTRLTVTSIAMLLFVATLVATSSAQPNYPYPPPYPSYALLQALSATQSLSTGDASQLQAWARQGTFQPPNPVFTQLDQVEAQITALAPPDRNAIATWLTGGGRGALYARNATDQQIGSCKFPIDPPSCTSGGGPVPNPSPTDWRSVPFALAPGANDASGVAIDGGFAAVKNDGTAEAHCLTFRNTNQKTAVAVTFTYALYGPSDNMLTNGNDIRSGTFSNGITIAGPKSLSDYQTLRNGVGNKDALQNCWTQSSGIANLAFLQATYVTVQVTSVRFDDGSSWPPTAPVPHPSATPQASASP